MQFTSKTVIFSLGAFPFSIAHGLQTFKYAGNICVLNKSGIIKQYRKTDNGERLLCGCTINSHTKNGDCVCYKGFKKSGAKGSAVSSATAVATCIPN